jgi:hypothetical protein
MFKETVFELSLIFLHIVQKEVERFRAVLGVNKGGE